jgi:hypothetical protein
LLAPPLRLRQILVVHLALGRPLFLWRFAIALTLRVGTLHERRTREGRIVVRLLRRLLIRWRVGRWIGRRGRIVGILIGLASGRIDIADLPGIL